MITSPYRSSRKSLYSHLIYLETEDKERKVLLNLFQVKTWEPEFEHRFVHPQGDVLFLHHAPLRPGPAEKCTVSVHT